MNFYVQCKECLEAGRPVKTSVKDFGGYFKTECLQDECPAVPLIQFKRGSMGPQQLRIGPWQELET